MNDHGPSGQKEMSVGLLGYALGETLALSSRYHLRRALRKSDGRPVVIKSLVAEYPSAREVRQLEFEYRILNKLRAPGVVAVLDIVKDGDREALVLEDVGGSDLSSLLSGQIPLDLFFAIALKLARALGYVHAENVIHKDIKPQNILFDPQSGAVKLIDFSISSELSLCHQDVVPKGEVEGTLPYISPEQTGRMNRDLDYRSDYYSFGVTLFELLTGSLPFTATDPLGWIHCHVSKPAPSARDVRPSIPEPLARLIGKLMAKNPDDRYQSIRGLLRDLEHCQQEWAAHGMIAEFELGKQDASERFQLSRALFGRERESATLFDAFAKVRQGSSRLLLVTGHSGIGKSSLIHELHREIARHGGRFVAGKCEQLKRDLPFGALGQALRELVNQLLAEPEERLRAWREKISEAIGPNGRVLLDLIPEIEQVVGPQPRVAELDAAEARNRFHRVFRDLLGALVSSAQPLVIFVDDLQWTDTSTPDLLAHLLGDEKLGHILVIGAYRDKEVIEGHPLRSAVAELRAGRPEAIQYLVLGPLSVDSVNQIVAATLHCDPAIGRPLGERILQKTAGNPFFVNELLGLLYREGAFRFVEEEGRWDWDYGKIDQMGPSDNVVDLVVQKLERLPPLTLVCLRLAACIGNRFDLRTLARLGKMSARAMATVLHAAVETQVLIPQGGNYRLVWDNGDDGDAEQSDLDVRYQFQHDRVREAAYAQLDGQERARTHLALGRILLAASGQGEAGQGLFDVVNHLNIGKDLVAGSEERTQLARLNHKAAQMAKRSTAYAVAATYFDVCVELLSAEERASQPGWFFECRRAHVECVYLAGDVDRAGLLCDDLAASAPDRLAAAAAFRLKGLVLSHQGRLVESVAAIREGLGRLGVGLPEDHAEIDRRIGEGIGKMQGRLARTPIEDLVRLPEMTDEVDIMTTNLLYEVVPSAIQTHYPLFVLVELMMFDLALTRGITAVSCKNFVDCGMIQAGRLGDFATAYRLGKVALALLERYAGTPLGSAVNLVFAAFVSHWRAPYREGLDAFARARRSGPKTGDVLSTAYSYAVELHRLLSVGIPIDQCQAKAESAIAYLNQTCSVTQLQIATIAQRALTLLRESTDDTRTLRPSDDEFTRKIIASKNPGAIFLHGQLQAMVSFLLGDIETAAEWEDLCVPCLLAGETHFAITDYYLFRTLILARRYRAASGSDREDMLEILASYQDKLRIWAENCPENFAHKHKLASAEIARIQHAPFEEVIRLYEEASTATGDGFLHLRALANELQADYWLEKGHAKIARSFLREAYSLYERWGGHRKLRQMERRSSRWLWPTTERSTLNHSTVSSPDTVLGGSLDITSVIKATQAISSEVQPDKLFAKLMAIIIENASAQRGCLILKAETGDDLTVAASATIDSNDSNPRKEPGSIAIDDRDDLCLQLVRYVARTCDTVVVDDASHHTVYQDDPYIRANSVKSVLALPVLNQGKLLAILYAENNAITHAFTPSRLTLLKVIAGQAAISISNARLYDHLEERVKSRTAELLRSNKLLTNEIKARERIEIELRQAQKLEAVGRLASGVAHEINTPIQFVGDSVNFVHSAWEDLAGLIAKYQAVNQATLQSSANDVPWRNLAQSAADVEEQADLAYLLENVPAALSRSLEGLDRVATIVASLKEFAHPDQKERTTVDLNRAILTTLTIARNEYKYVAEVETDLGKLPPVTCHAGEVNQVILNLIVNAAHTIGDRVRGTDQKGLIKIGTRHEDGMVVISIADTGCGIPEAIRDKIFDPFFTTKEIGKGTGQGLFFARSVVVEKHGGTLTFESEVGKGTTFFVRLPACG
jgi:predicted ATPase/signal transduction histidine kinase